MRISNIIRAILDPFKRKDDSLFGDAAAKINQDLKEQNKGWIKASDFERMFREFKDSEIYGKTMSYLISKKEEDKPNLNELRNILSENFKEFRQFLKSVALKMNDSDINYCILILAGFKQMYLHKLMNISQSGIRNIKSRLEKKLPPYLYKTIVITHHYNIG